MVKRIFLVVSCQERKAREHLNYGTVKKKVERKLVEWFLMILSTSSLLLCFTAEKVFVCAYFNYSLFRVYKKHIPSFPFSRNLTGRINKTTHHHFRNNYMNHAPLSLNFLGKFNILCQIIMIHFEHSSAWRWFDVSIASPRLKDLFAQHRRKKILIVFP